MRDFASTFIDMMVDTNRQFVDEISKEQELEADCQCNGGGFAYCEACHGE